MCLKVVLLCSWDLQGSGAARTFISGTARPESLPESRYKLEFDALGLPAAYLFLVSYNR